jgi:hypothetical protein
MSEKANLRKFIESWFGKKFPHDAAASDFDLQKLLGRRCLINITHTERGTKVYADVNNATPIPKGMVADQVQHNPSLYYSLETPSEMTFKSLPKFLQEKITNRIPEKKTKQEEPEYPIPEFDDPLPF